MDFDNPLPVAAILLPAAAACLIAWSAATAQAAGRTLAVEAGDHPRACVPMCVDLPDGVAKAKMTSGGKGVPCQVAEGKLWWMLEGLAAGATKTYQVEFGATSGAAAAVELKKTPGTIDVTIDGKRFTSYHYVLKKYRGHQLRRPYFFPVYGPGQVTLTRPFPLTEDEIPKNVATDHPHHTSIWVAHGKVNGVDNWAIGSRAGWQLHKSFEAVESGAVVGFFRETLDWASRDRKPVLAETRTVRIYRQPDSARMLDLEITFQAKYGKVVFGDTKEGGLCATRMRPELRADKKGKSGRLVNSEGQTAGGAWGKKATWVDCSGLVDGKRLGFAIFDTPGNLRHPTTWHARTYGLLTANPFGLSHFDRRSGKRGDYTLEADKQRTFRYRIYFHPGSEKQAKVAERYADYAEPPKATWK